MSKDNVGAPRWTLLPSPTPVAETGTTRKRKRGRWLSQTPSRRLALMADQRVGGSGLERLAAANVLTTLLTWLDDSSLGALEATARLEEAQTSLRQAWVARLGNVGRKVLEKYALTPEACAKKAYLFHEKVHRQWRGGRETVANRKVVHIKFSSAPFPLQMLRLSDSERDREFCATSILASASPSKLTVHDLNTALRTEPGSASPAQAGNTCSVDTARIVRCCALTGSFEDATLVTGSGGGLELWSHRNTGLHHELKLDDQGTSVVKLQARWGAGQVISGDLQGRVSVWDVCKAERLVRQTAVVAELLCLHDENEVILANHHEVWRWDPRTAPRPHAGLQLLYQDYTRRISDLGACNGRFAISKASFQGIEVHEFRGKIGSPQSAIATRAAPYGGCIQFDHDRILTSVRRPYIDKVALTPDLEPTQSFELPVSLSERDRLGEFCSDANSTCVVRADMSGRQIFLWPLEPRLALSQPFSYEACFAPLEPLFMPRVARGSALLSAAPAADPIVRQSATPTLHEHQGVLLPSMPIRPLPQKEHGGVRLL